MTTTGTEAGVELRTEDSTIPGRQRRRGWLVRRALAAADVTGLAVSFLVAQWLFAPDPSVGDALSPSAETLLFFGTLPAWLVVAKLHGLYDRDEERTDHSTADDLPGVFQMVTAGVWLFFVVAWLTGIVVPEIGKLVAFWLLSVVLVSLLRAWSRALCRRRPGYLQNTIIVGAGDVGGLIARKIRNHPEYGLDLLGFVEVGSNGMVNEAIAPVLGDPESIVELVHTYNVERVIIAFLNADHEQTLSLIRTLQDFDIEIDVVPRLFEMVFPGVSVHTVEGLPLLGLPRFGLSRSSALIKRATDIVVAGTAFVVLAPLLAIISLLIKVDSPGPALFRQTRVGRRGVSFEIYKFRSMTVDADKRKSDAAHLNMHLAGDYRMFKIPQDPRVTRVGRFLRRYSLDELPQLFNVLQGDMSLVGPRPLILEEAVHVPHWARKRLDLRPGMTGLWQVLGRSDIPFGEMTQLDYRYVMSWSLWNDFRLVFQTVPAVLRNRGAY